MENTIIVIDDDRDYLDIIKKGLNSAGFKNVRIEDNPLKVASVFEGGQEFDIALIDMNMPDMDGMDILRTVRKTSPDVNVIVMTGYSTVQNAVEAMKLGAFDYLSKPFTDEQLKMSEEKGV